MNSKTSSRSNGARSTCSEKLHYALHRQFGRSAERFDAGQSELFAPSTDEDVGSEDEEGTTEVVVRRKKGGRRKAPEDLPRVRVEHDLAEADKRSNAVPASRVSARRPANSTT